MTNRNTDKNTVMNRQQIFSIAALGYWDMNLVPSSMHWDLLRCVSIMFSVRERSNKIS